VAAETAFTWGFRDMKSILFINYEYPPIGAGAANATYNIAVAMAKKGIQSSVMTSAFFNMRGLSIEEGVSVHRIPAFRNHAGRSSLLQMLLYLLSALLHLPFILRREGPDAVIAFFGFPCGPIALLARMFWKLPYLLMLRGGDVPGFEPRLHNIHRLLRPLRRTIYRNSTAIIANSEGLKTLATEADPGFSIHVIANGVDTDFFHPLELSGNTAGAFSFLFAGRFCEQKNIGCFLKAFAICRTELPMVRLVLIGEGPEARALQMLSHQLGIDSSLRLPGWCSKKNLLSYYQSSHCFVIPSVNEGMSNALLEAMACGLPVLAGDCMGNREVIINGDNGFLFNPHDHRELAEKMVALAKKPQWAATLGACGRKICRNRFSWVTATEKISNLIIEGISNR
jgi:glycosyltransferase involved in cell wall biosynthesis